MATISIIIAAYNGEQYIAEALSSVLAQTYRDFEIVVVDDGSSDRTSAIVKEHIEKRPGKIRYFYQKNKGIAAARNTGIRNSSGEFIAFIDQDDLWLPQKLEEQICYFKKNPEAALVYTDSIEFGDRASTMESPAYEGDIFIELLKNNFIPALSVMVREDVFKNIGYFDEDRDIMGCDDYDMWLRVSYKYKVGHIKRKLVRWRASSSGYTFTHNYKMLTAKLKVIKKISSLYTLKPKRNKSIRNTINTLRHDFTVYVLKRMIRLRKIDPTFLLKQLKVDFVTYIYFVPNALLIFWKWLANRFRDMDPDMRLNVTLRYIPSAIQLKKIDSAKVPFSANEIRLFMNVRNASMQLPYFFKYYSKMGVDRFFVVVNDSTDGTKDFLLSQENTHIFETKESYRNAVSGTTWRNNLLNKYGKGHWCISIDADEIFIFPHYEEINIRDLCNFLDEENSDAIRCIWLQMYSDKPIKSTGYEKGEDPLLDCFYFDKNSLDANAPHPQMLRRTRNINKVGVFKYKPGILLSVGNHYIHGGNMSDITGAVLHFPYFSRFITKAHEEAGRGEYRGGADGYYGHIRKVINANQDINLHHPGSIKFKDSKQLVDLKITKMSQSFQKFVKDLTK
jgi:glycosyltransferase involved in cell wall biosynthesis